MKGKYMAFQVSPGVQVKEVDLTNVVPAVSTSIGAIAGAFQWGPVEEITTVGSEQQLVNKFGKPDGNTYKYFYPAAQFLQYGNSLRVVRAATGNLNATASGTGILVKNDDHYDTVTPGATDTFIARFPGLLGNSLQVSVCPADATAFAGWAYAGSFDSVPGTSTFSTNNSGDTADEMHIAVVDQDGAWTGTAGTVLETFAFVSQASNAKADDGTDNYYANVINNQSAYVRWGAHDAALTDAGSTINGAAGAAFVTGSTAISVSLSGGTDDNAATVGELSTAYDLFDDAETIDVNLLIGPETAAADDVTMANYMIAIAEGRKDCVAFVSPAVAETVNNATAATDVKAWADALTSSSYAVIDSTALYVYDKYNDVYRWVPLNADVAGLAARTDFTNDAWFSPAGLSRGQIKSVVRLGVNPNKTQRDTLYKNGVNPVVSFPGEGTVLFGDKTALSRPSAFDRINVRRLFIVLEKAISTAAKFSLFEFNDEFTRAQFRNLVEPFLRDVQGRRGIFDFRVVCDETNNTGEVIDRNEFVGDIYVKPARSINFIQLNFVAVRSGVEFSEVVGQF